MHDDPPCPADEVGEFAGALRPFFCRPLNSGAPSHGLIQAESAVATLDEIGPASTMGTAMVTIVISGPPSSKCGSVT